MCSTQGSHSARAAMKATATTDQSGAGEMKSATEEQPLGRLKNISPPGQRGARAGKMSLERVCAAVGETHRDPFLSWHWIRTLESSTGCSGPPTPTAGLDRALRSGFGVRRVETKGEWKEEGRK